MYKSEIICDHCNAVIEWKNKMVTFINPHHVAEVRILTGKGEMGEVVSDFCSFDCAIRWLEYKRVEHDKKAG